MAVRNRAFFTVSRVALASTGVLVALGAPLLPSAIAPVQAPSTGSASVLSALTLPTAQAEPPERLQSELVDTMGVLTPGEEDELTRHIQQVKQDKQVLVSVVVINSFDGETPENWAKAVWQKQGAAMNRVIVAIAVGDRNIGVWTGDQVDATAEEIAQSAFSFLSQNNWYDGADAAISAAGGNSNSGTPGSNDGGSLGEGGTAALAVGGVGAAAVAGGAWAFSRQSKKKRNAAEIEAGRKIDPRKIDDLDKLSTPTLDALAREEIISTDESIRKAETELNLARSEFGDGRVRDLEKALKHSRSTLNRAFELRHQLDADPDTDNLQQRSLMLEIISTCGTADDRLDDQAAKFQEMRQDLMNADQTLTQLTQRTVDIRTRIPQAKTTLDSLRARYDESMLSSIEDNIDMATEHLNMAENSAAQARKTLSLPAGEQGSLVDQITATDFALDQANKLIEGIEHADTDIAQAVAGLEALTAEVRGEIDEGTNLLAAPDAANVDREKLNAAIESGREALGTAAQVASADPLSAWTTLTDADADLDEALDAARDATQSYARAMQTLRNAMTDAETHIHVAEDLIATRRRIVGSSARTKLAEAQRYFAEAQRAQDSDPRAAITAARRAGQLAREASRLAKLDIDRYNNSRRNSGGNSGAMVAGMVLGSMLSNGGGFGGGFGGGGFSGGSSGGSGASMGF